MPDRDSVHSVIVVLQLSMEGKEPSNINISITNSQFLILVHDEENHNTNSNTKNNNYSTNTNLVSNGNSIHILQIIVSLLNYAKDISSNIGIRLHLFNFFICPNQYFMLIAQRFKCTMTDAFTFISACFDLIQNSCSTITKHKQRNNTPSAESIPQPSSSSFLQHPNIKHGKSIHTDPTSDALFNLASNLLISFFMVASDCSISRTDPIA